MRRQWEASATSLADHPLRRPRSALPRPPTAAGPSRGSSTASCQGIWLPSSLAPTQARAAAYRALCAASSHASSPAKSWSSASPACTPAAGATTSGASRAPVNGLRDHMPSTWPFDLLHACLRHSA